MVKNRRQLLVLAACGLFAASTARGETALVVVDRFDQAVQNERDGYRNTFQRLPSRATALRVRDPQRGVGGHSMRVTATRSTAGFCGFWLHFFDMQSPQPAYLDARQFGYLSFWVRGQRGGETFDIRLADANLVGKEDAILLGPVANFLEGGVTQQWQEVLVPLRSGKIDWSRLAGLTIEFATPGECTVYLEDVAFKSTADVFTPESALPPRIRSEVRLPSRALWLWSTRDLLSNPRAGRELLEFCQQCHVGQIWMQLPYEVERLEPATPKAISVAETAAVRISIQSQRELRNVIALAHMRNIDVHALDGAPELCLKTNHAIPLSVIDAVIEFNRQGNMQERFDGVHFDNEPYLLLGWHLPSRREQILREYLELNVECQRRVRERSGMQFGVDIPFWWQALDSTSGECHAAVEFHGVRQAASFHCIDILDNVGVMNYRDTADGADGILAHGRALMQYAQRAQHAKIYMGVETFAEADRPVWFLVGIPRDQFHKAISRHVSLANQSRIDGHRLHLLDDGERVHLGIEIAREMSGQQYAAAENALRLLAASFALPTEDDGQTARQLLRAKSTIDADPEWQGFQIRDLSADGEMPAVPGFVAESVMLSKVTFGDNTLPEFDEQLSAAEDYFIDFASYGGVAIHFYETYRKLRESPH